MGFKAVFAFHSLHVWFKYNITACNFNCMMIPIYNSTIFYCNQPHFHCWNSLLSNIPGTEEGLCKYNEQGPNKSIKVK